MHGNPAHAGVTERAAVPRPQVRNIALTCTADLLKDPSAHATALASRRFTAGLLAALKVGL